MRTEPPDSPKLDGRRTPPVRLTTIALEMENALPRTEAAEYYRVLVERKP